MASGEGGIFRLPTWSASLVSTETRTRTLSPRIAAPPNQDFTCKQIPISKEPAHAFRDNLVEQPRLPLPVAPSQPEEHCIHKCRPAPAIIIGTVISAIIYSLRNISCTVCEKNPDIGGTWFRESLARMLLRSPGALGPTGFPDKT